MRPGDVVVHLNFRADRARQLTHALAHAGVRPASTAARAARPLDVTTLTEYQAPDELPVAVAFPPLVIDSLAAHLSRLGRRQLHVAETEKYAHVTYFFNGGVEEPFPGEERDPRALEPRGADLRPRPGDERRRRSPTRSSRPSAGTSYDFIVANYANPDMVGHTGVWDGRGRGRETSSTAASGGCRARRSASGAALVITADHGNIEEMRDADGQPADEAHDLAGADRARVGERVRGRGCATATLADVAPTLCELLGIPPGPEMTGRCLLA